MPTIAGRIYRLLADTKSVEGLDIVGVEDANASQLANLEDALALIRFHSPWTYAHALSHIDGIGVSQVDGIRVGNWVNLIWVGTDRLDREDTEWLAASLVYTMALARLRRAAPSRRHAFRRFRVAFEHQVRFARSLPTGYAIVEHLTRCGDSGWYSPIRQRELSSAQLRRIGVPDWLVRVINWLGVRLERV